MKSLSPFLIILSSLSLSLSLVACGHQNQNKLYGKWSLLNSENKCANQAMQKNLDTATHKFDPQGATFYFMPSNKYISTNPIRKSMGLPDNRDGSYELRNDSLIISTGGERIQSYKITSLDSNKLILQYDALIDNEPCTMIDYYEKIVSR